MNVTVALMAFQAFELKTYQMTGAYDDKDRYDVQAKAPATVARRARPEPGS